MLPILFYFLEYPNDGFSSDRFKSELTGKDLKVARVAPRVVGASSGLAASFLRKQNPIELRFNELTVASVSQASRDYYSGRFVTLKGQFFPYDDRNFTLYRLRISCCASDAVPLKVRIICDFVHDGIEKGQWVDVVGEVRFVENPEKANEWIPVMLIQEQKDIRKIDKPSELYENV